MLQLFDVHTNDIPKRSEPTKPKLLLFVGLLDGEPAGKALFSLLASDFDASGCAFAALGVTGQWRAHLDFRQTFWNL